MANELPDISDRTSVEKYLDDCRYSFSFTKVNSEDVGKVIDSLKPKNSSGYDNISTIMIKAAKSTLTEPLTTIVNQCIETGIFPDSLKIAKVLPVFKKGDNNIVDNYRPISLLPVISKVFEKIMHHQLMNYFDCHNLLYKHQYGFRPKHSTEHAALELTDRILSAMSTNKTPVSIFIDLSKAFDTLDHRILLLKLKNYGITGTALQLLTDYLDSRQQFTQFNNNCSSFSTVRTGVPQGSVLGPLLFLIYINDMANSTSFFYILSYADDTTLFCSFDKFENLAVLLNEMNNEIQKFDDWLTVNKLALNIEKTKFMLFSKQPKFVPDVRPLIRNSPLQKVSQFDFLGVLFDSALTWKPHINKISNKISRISGVICRLRHILPKHILLCLYNALIMPHLNYSILTWGFANTKRLLLLQKKCCRFISNCSFDSHALPLFKNLCILTIDDIFLLGLLKFYFKLIKGLLPSYFDDILPRRTSHTFNTRFSILLTNSASSKLYCDKCVRYGIAKIVNHSVFKSPSFDKDIYISDFCYNKLLSKSPELLSDILCKTDSHSFNGYCWYIKTRFLQEYV